MLPVQNSGENLKNTAIMKNLARNEYLNKYLNKRKEGYGRETKSKPANSGLRKSSCIR
jgi:hypothetical protein